MVSRDLKDLVLDFRARVQNLLHACRARGVEMRPYTTLRDPFEQARLWRQSRTRQEIERQIQHLREAEARFLAHCLESVGPQYGRLVTHAPPGLSWHQWGEAVDCYWDVDGHAEWSPERKVNGLNGYRVYAEEARKLGLTAGGLWNNFPDWPHVQLRPAYSPQDVLSLRQIDEAMRAGFDDGSVPQPFPSDETRPAPAPANCDDWAEIEDGQYVLQNSIWNRSTAAAAKQCIERGSQPRYRWHWQWPDLQDGQVRSYPAVLFGRKPWRATSTTTRLPAQVASIEQLSAQYEIEASGSGVFNTAFDLWLCSGPIPAEDSITTEIMVWVQNQGGIPAGTPLATAGTSLGDLTLFRGRIESWTYLALVAKDPIPEGTLDIAELLALLAYNGYVDDKDYLASVELGTEIWHGQGSASVKRFAMV